MPQIADNFLGVLPSLDVLPLFARNTENGLVTWGSFFQIRSHSSYGEIARQLLTRKLAAGVLPWEIFVADVLSLPGQRNQWTVSLFMDACPTELILRHSVHRTFYPVNSVSRPKLPSRLVVGIQNHHSLTRLQFQEWLSQWKGHAKIEVIYKVLPMGIRIQALEAEAVDVTIAPSPWGRYAESMDIGTCDVWFSPGRFTQEVALVCRKDFLENHQDTAKQFPQMMASAMHSLKQPGEMAKAVRRMGGVGKPMLERELFENAATFHGYDSIPPAVAPDTRRLTLALKRLDELGILPAQVAAGEQTARLLASDQTSAQ
jgi:hypothetical protein